MAGGVGFEPDNLNRYLNLSRAASALVSTTSNSRLTFRNFSIFGVESKRPTPFKVQNL